MKSSSSSRLEEDDTAHDSPIPPSLGPNHREGGKWFLEETNGLRTSRGDEQDGLVSKPSSAATVLGLTIAGLRRLNLSLHILLLALHVVLVVMYSQHLEQRIIVPYSEGSKFPTILSVSLQAFYTLYTAVLVAVTQRLGLLRTLHCRQKLTTLADASSAWTGIGNALIGLWNNARMPKGALLSIIIAAYLASTTVLHVFGSSVLTFQPHNQTVMMSLPTWITWPNASSEVWTGFGAETPGLAWGPITDIMANEQILKGFLTQRQGIVGPTLYDTLQPTSAAGIAQVNATTIGFECGLLPNVSANGVSTVSWNGQTFLAVSPFTDQVIFNRDIAQYITWTSVNVQSSHSYPTCDPSTQASLNSLTYPS